MIYVAMEKLRGFLVLFEMLEASERGGRGGQVQAASEPISTRSGFDARAEDGREEEKTPGE